jgi:hypothetical protein
MIQVAQVAVCSQTNTKHINAVWAERTVLDFFSSNATTCPARTLCPPPGCGCSVTDFWGWDAQGARLRRPDDDGKVMDESVVPVGP